jgi:hypothetical protein
MDIAQFAGGSQHPVASSRLRKAARRALNENPATAWQVHRASGCNPLFCGQSRV